MNAPRSLAAETRQVVIASPCHYTGGPEALHQLDHALRGLGLDSRVHYYGDFAEAVANDFHARYGSRRSDGRPSPGALLVLPELEDPLAWRAAGWRRIVVWWLAAPRQLPLSHYEGCFHLFQSAHARDRRAADGITGFLVSDYLREDLFVDNADEHTPGFARRDLIAFNHRSAAWLASVGVAELPEGRLRLLAGLSPGQVAAVLRRARYFVDVGWHPGRDRMLREAAMHGARVLVGRQGAAACPEDVPLPDCARIEDHDPGSLSRRIAECEADPGPITRAMTDYRRWIRGQKANFVREVGAWLTAPDGPFQTDTPAALAPRPSDPVPELERELARSRALLSAVGCRLFAQRQTRRPSGWLIRLEIAAARLLKRRRINR